MLSFFYKGGPRLYPLLLCSIVWARSRWNALSQLESKGSKIFR